MMRWLAILIAFLTAPLGAQAIPDPRATVARGIAAHGGELWCSPGTLILSGHAEFYDPKTGELLRRIDDYRMWRVFDHDRESAHGAEGKVRILAREGERTFFEVGYDGETTWNQNGIVPTAEADAMWSSNFGFGVIRSALADGFTLERAPPRDIGGHRIELVRVIDPQGAPTLFGFDAESGFIRYLAFDSPRGFHERVYDDFVKLESGWVQAREVTLLYDGVKANTVFWREVRVGERIADEVFAWRGKAK